MKLRAFYVLIFAMAFSCKAKDSTPEGIKDDLKKTMQTYLYSEVNNDSSNIKYNIEDVIYFDDNLKHRYVCEFTVNLKEKLFDTTGKMKAYISKDFKTVQRLY